MKIILDTNFILSCIVHKVDFLETEKFGELLIPIQVVDELKRKSEEGRGKDRDNACLALEIIRKNKSRLEKIKLEKKFVDAGINRYAEKNKNIAVATLDKELKRRLKGKARILTLKAKKKIQWA